MEYKVYIQKPFLIEAYQDENGDYVTKYFNGATYEDKVVPKEVFEDTYKLATAEELYVRGID